ncbi:MAG: glycosyltransferase family 4 protein [Actinomycetota bacterium]
MGAAARRRVRERFTVDAMVERTASALEDAAGCSGHAAHRPENDVVIVVGPRRESMGGVSTHVQTHLEGGLGRWFHLVPVEIGYWEAPASRFRRVLDAVRKMRSFGRLLRTYPRAIVHLNPSMDTKSMARDMPFLWIAARRRVPVVVQFHGQLIHRYRAARNPVLRRLMLASLRRARLIVVLSALQARSLEQAFGVSARLPVRTMPALFLDLRPYDERQAKRAATGRTRRFVFLGRLAREKGVGDLLHAVAALREAHPDLVVDAVGAGPDEDALRRKAQALGIGDVLTWHGHVGGDDKLDLLARADAFVLPSWGEGLPNALVEAMAMGLPVVVSDAGAMAEVVEDGVNGFVVPARDARALADKMAYLIENPEQAREMGRRNRAIAAARFGLDSQVETWRGIYSQLLEASAR